MNKFAFWKEVAAISHGKVNISGGNVFQHEIYLVIKESGKHNEVYEEKKIPLLSGKRQNHKVDILIVDDDNVIAINSKGKSFNNTDSPDAKLSDVKHFIQSIQAVYPDKKVVYQFLKDEWYSGKKGQELFDYFAENDVPVYNTERYLIDNYDIDFDALEQRRQTECIRRAEEAWKNAGYNLEKLYETCN
tara:strand:- start:283 stop:849 length:567 start_codon:yes stop_codon:yes gene_type:complete